MLDKVEQDAEKVWDLWREGLITYEEVQERLDNDVLPWQPKGFFKTLETEIRKLVNVRIPMQAKYRLTDLAYFSKWAKLETEIVKDTDWASYWRNCSWLDYPSEQDKLDVRNLDVEDLTEFHILIFKSLIDLAKQDLQDSEACKKLHKFYQLTRPEMEGRGVFKVHGDAFLEFLGEKQVHIEKEHEIADARVTGNICIHCGSKNVASNGNMWRCKSCKRNFRKH